MEGDPLAIWSEGQKALADLFGITPCGKCGSSSEAHTDGVCPPPIVAKKIGHFVQVSDEELRWAEEDRRARDEFNALPPQEQARLRAEAAERRAAEKAERTCDHCGCDPDEHGGY